MGPRCRIKSTDEKYQHEHLEPFVSHIVVVLQETILCCGADMCQNAPLINWTTSVLDHSRYASATRLCPWRFAIVPTLATPYPGGIPGDSPDGRCPSTVEDSRFQAVSRVELYVTQYASDYEASGAYFWTDFGVHTVGSWPHKGPPRRRAL